MQYKDDILPIGGLNRDNDPRHYELGDYYSARNLHLATGQTQGDKGLLQTLQSTLDLSLPTIGDNIWVNPTVLGVAVDEENDRAYLQLFVTTNTNVNHFVIIKHDLLDNTFKIIYDGDADEWNIIYRDDANWKFFNPRVVDGNLIWTDNENNIRMINVDKMEATVDASIDKTVIWWNATYSNGTGYATGDLIWFGTTVYEVLQSTLGQSGTPNTLPLYYNPIALTKDVYLNIDNPTNFTLAALPPLLAPLAAYSPLSSKNINSLRGQTWQFSYRYIYMDWRRSTYAPPSMVPPPDQEEDKNGEPNPDTTHNNRIIVTVDSGNEQVRSVQIIARSSEDPGTWFLIDEIVLFTDKNERPIAPNVPIEVEFFNDSSKVPVNVIEVYTPFSYVPIRAKHMELIEGNRLAFANITEGYGRISSDVSLALSWLDLSGISVVKKYQSVYYDSYTLAGDTNTYYVLRYTLDATNPGAGTYKVRMRFDYGDPWEEAEYVWSGSGAYPADVRTGLLAAIEAKWPGETVTCNINLSPPPDGTYQFCAFPMTAPLGLPYFPYISREWEFYIEIPSIDEVNKYPTLKTGTTQSWGIVYRDEVGRLSPVIGSGSIELYIPFATESLTSNVNNIPQVNFQINHVPPPWAVSYEIVYAGNKSISWWLHLYGYNFSSGRRNHTDPLTPEVLDNTYRLRIASAQAQTRSFLQNWSVEDYQWQKGDRMRIFGKVLADVDELNGVIYDVEITGVFVDSDFENNLDPNKPSSVDIVDNEWIYFKKDPNIVLTPVVTGSYWSDELYIEIYRPLKTESGLFFTTGMTFDVLTDVYGNKLHEGDISNQVLNASGESTSAAVVTNTSHDAWKYIRNFRTLADDTTLRLWAESQFASDYYITQQLDSRGNPIPDVDSQQQNVLTKRVRHGGTISIGSQLNFLADFEFDKYKDLKDEHGPIEGLRLVGFVLKVVQYTKITAIYIGRQESFSASGNAQYLFTDSVFGSLRPSMENWGTSHPGSVLVHNRHLYFWDQSEGIIVRDAANGPQAISDYKMRQYFTDLAKTQDGYAKTLQYTFFAFSMETEQLFCLFGQGSNVKEVLTFSENDNRWKNEIDVRFIKGAFYSLGRRIFSTYERTVYEWWRGSDYMNITGVAVTGSLSVYSNIDPKKLKTFDSIAVYQTGARPVFSSLDIPDKATAVSGPMETYIYDVNIEEREGVYYCQILRDRNTPGPQAQEWKELNGRRMRGIFLNIVMSFSGVNKIVISNLAVLSTPSERSS